MTLTMPATGKQVGKPTGLHSDHDFDRRYFADGNSLVMAVNPGSSAYYVKHFELPSGAVNWSTGQTPVQVSDVSVTGSTVIGWNGYEPNTGIVAYDLATGKQLWMLKNAEFCAAVHNRVLVSINRQLAILDATNGNQLSYDASNGDCPSLLANGIRWSAKGQLIVDQYL